MSMDSSSTCGEPPSSERQKHLHGDNVAVAGRRQPGRGFLAGDEAGLDRAG
jgi:hypothetical protein